MQREMSTGWVSVSLPGRSCGGTYCLCDLENLPPLPPPSLRGLFDWLPDPGRRLEWALGNSDRDRVFDPATLTRLASMAAREGLSLPAPFQRFLGSELRDRVRSATGCWLELPDRLVKFPDSDRTAVRFLNDQQGLLFWYLVLGSNSDDGVVVSNDLLDAAERWLPPGQAAGLFWCAPSFESFIRRFWVENEIVFRVLDEQPLSAEQQTYLDLYRLPRAFAPP